MHLEPGRSLSHFRIVARIGAGGMGVVYRAVDEKLDRPVAIKVLPPERMADPERRRRFRREARAEAALNHPNIAAIYEVDDSSGLVFLVMEYVEGRTLRERLQPRPLPIAEALRIGAEIAEGLAHAHEHRVIHRDLKPENVMVREDGHVKLLDFGLAKLLEEPKASGGSPSTVSTQTAELTAAGRVMGTVEYLSPEQARGQDVDHRSDVFSFGVLLYEMVTGRTPFRGETAADTLSGILEREAAPASTWNASVPEGLERLLRRCLAKAPSERYDSARDLRADLLSLGGEAAGPAARRWSRRQVAWGMAGVAGLAVVATLLTWGGSRWEWFGEAAPYPLAVVPFAGIGMDPEVEYLADGLADSIIDRMSRLKEVKVISWNSVAKYKGRTVEARQVGQELNVRAVLVGRVGYRSDELEMQVELIDAGDNTRLWGERYKGQFRDVFAIQDAIADQIGENLRLHLARDEERLLARPPTADPEAYKLYLRGRHLLLNYSTQEDIRQAIDYFNRAIAADPSFARAYAGIADSHYFLSSLYLPPTEAMPRVRAAARRALELDPSLGGAYTSLGIVKHIYEWDFPGAQRDLRRAIELAPSDAWAHLFLGTSLALTGFPEEASAEIARAQELDPLSSFIRAYTGFCLYLVRRYDEAGSELRALLAEEPAYYLARAFLGLVYEQTGRIDEAIAEFRAAADADETSEALAQLGHAYAVAGYRAEALRILEELRRMSASRYVSPYNVALIHAGLEDRDETLAWLEKAIEDRSEWVPSLGSDPRLDWIRSDPRFAELLRRVNLEL